jgi:hypothetical protein
MSHSDDFIGQLEDYLETFDGTTPLPDRVRGAIRAELPSARQVQPRTGPMRVFTMLSNASAGARVALAAAAVVVAVVLGAAFLNNNQRGANVGAPDTPAPTVTTSPTIVPTQPATSAPSSAAAPPTLKYATLAPCNAADTQANTCVSPGTYQLNNWPGSNTWPVMVTIDVPAGWFEWDADAGFDGVLVVDGDPNAAASGWGIMFTTVGDVSRDPCDPRKGTIPAAQVSTPQKLAAVMAAWPQFKATAPQPITVDGHSGLKLQLTSTGPDSCRDTGRIWRTTTGGTMNVYPMIGAPTTTARAPGTFEIVATGNGLLVIRTTDFPQTSPTEISGGVAPDPTRHAADQTELHAIHDSIRLTALPAAP